MWLIRRRFICVPAVWAGVVPLSAACFADDADAQGVALGHGAAAQIHLGQTADGRALRVMTVDQDRPEASRLQ